MARVSVSGPECDDSGAGRDDQGDQAARIAALEGGGGSVVVGAPTRNSGGDALGIWNAALPTHTRSTPDNRCNPNAEVLAGQDNNGNSAYGTWDAAMGYYIGCSYARGYLHLLTDVSCGSGGAGGIFQFGVTGLVMSLGPFDCQVSGIANSHWSVTTTFAECAYGRSFMAITAYCSSAQKKITLRLGAGNGAVAQESGVDATYWHGSSISVAAYSRSNTATILQALHSTKQDEDFDVGVDRRTG